MSQTDLTDVLKELAVQTARTRKFLGDQSTLLTDVKMELELIRTERTTFTDAIQQLVQMLANRKELDEEALPSFLQGVSNMFQETKDALHDLNRLMLDNVDRSQTLKASSWGKKLSFIPQNVEELIEVFSQIIAHSKNLPYEAVFAEFVNFTSELAFADGSTLQADLKDQSEEGIQRRIVIFHKSIQFAVDKWQIDYTTEVALASYYLSHLSNFTGIKPVSNPVLSDVMLMIDRARKANQYCRECRFNPTNIQLDVNRLNGEKDQFHEEKDKAEDNNTKST